MLKNELAVQESWFGFWAPERTPADVVGRLHAAVVRGLAQPGVRERFEATGKSVVASESPQAFAAFVRSENRKWAEIIKLAGVSVA